MFKKMSRKCNPDVIRMIFSNVFGTFALYRLDNNTM